MCEPSERTADIANADNLRGKFRKRCKVSLWTAAACDNTHIHSVQRKTHPLVDGAQA